MIKGKVKMEKNLQLYLHIPFCIQKCDYCDFLSFPMEEGAREKWLQREGLGEQSAVVSVNEEGRKQYIDALINEIKSNKEKYESYKISTIFMGGGTPSILLSEEILAIFTALEESFEVDKEAEITIEVNPGTVTEDKIVAWKRVGINRISIGLQSANDKELKLLGRIHTFHQFKETFSLLREHGFSNINVDLISGVPGQTVESYMKTLNRVIELNPEHISAYGLMIEEGTKLGGIYIEREENVGKKYIANEKEDEKRCFFERLQPYVVRDSYPDLPNEEIERQMYKITKERLKQYGYHQYEMTNYSKKGFECKHNIGYWERENYLGMGLGAASLIGNVRFSQVRGLDRYIEEFSFEKGLQPKEPKDRVILDEKEQMEEFMFLGLRKTKGISKTKFKENFDKNIDQVYGGILVNMEKESLIEINDDEIRLTEKGIDVSNYVLAEFIF